MKWLFGSWLLVLLLHSTTLAQESEPWGSEQRLKAVMAWIPAKAEAPGRPLTERVAWKRLAATKGWSAVVSRAERELQRALPPQPDALFLDFSRTGNRTRWQRVAGMRRGRIKTFLLAECVEARGRFLPALESTIRAVCSEKTWVMPAHDRDLANFNGRRIDIDLESSRLAWSLAIAHALLGERLGPATRRLLHTQVERRVLQPFRDMATGRRPMNWWMRTTNNWNSVCLAGVTGSALALSESRRDRAFFIVAAESFSRSFLRGFTRDGYCSEGLGYWNYGFGHYVLLAETLWQTTGGRLDMFDRPEAREPACFGSRLELVGGVYPAFADCRPDARPDARLMGFISRRLGLGLTRWEQGLRPSSAGTLPTALLYSFPNSATSTPAAAPRAKTSPLRTWFDAAGILICRPGASSRAVPSVALKGGHNGEHHNHNDVGSYIVALGDRAVLADPGSEVYTRRTFSSKRYESGVLSSFGHPVPLVDGRLQRAGSNARARIVRKQFSQVADTLVLDLRSAYAVPGIKRLERTFVYSREGTGALTVTDAVHFVDPRSFGTALITFGDWKQQPDGTLMVTDGPRALRVEMRTSGGALRITPKRIDEDLPGRRKPMRIGIALATPVSQATISLRITPAR